MEADLKLDLEKFTEENLHDFYRLLSIDNDFDIIDGMHSLVPHLEKNKEHFESIRPIAAKVYEHEFKGNWLSYRNPEQYIALIKERYEGDRDEIQF
jgi:hypothetical protein